MAKILPQRELRNRNAQVIDAVIAGETFIVTRNGERVAELRPLGTARQTFVTRSQIAALATSGLRIDPRQFRLDLDRAMDQGL